MQRDIGNEFIVAIVAVGVLAFAVAFAIILSLSGGTGQAPTVTPPVLVGVLTIVYQTEVAQQSTIEPSVVSATKAASSSTSITNSASVVPTNTAGQSSTSTTRATVTEPNATSMIEPTATTAPPTEIKATSTLKPITNTPLPSATKQSTDAPTATSTLKPITNTPLPSATKQPTSAPIASTTPSSTPKPTNTKTPEPSAPPSATHTRIAPTVTFTRTLIPASATPRPTSTLVPSATATKTSTPRPTTTLTATRTASPIPSPTPSATFTATKTLTKTPLPTATASPTRPTATATSSPAPCTLPSGWVTYTVRRGDTLASIAQKTGSTIDALQAINCIANINNIIVGQSLFVPAQSSNTGATSFIFEGCTDAGTLITNLKVGQLVSGIVKVEGTATIDDFAFYKLEIRPDSSNVYTLYNSYIKAVLQGSLGEIDTRIFPPGIYWVKLTVINQNNQSTPSCAVPLLFGQ